VPIACLLALVPTLSLAQQLFWTKTTVPPLDGYPANTALYCNPSKSLCIQRVVLEVENGKYHHSERPSQCAKDFDAASVMANLTKGLGQKQGTKTSRAGAKLVAVDFLVGVANHATERGIIKGSLGNYLAEKSYGDFTGRCVAFCVALPEKAVLQSLPSSVYDPEYGWANCSGEHCNTPGYSGWVASPRKVGNAVCGVFNNWAHDRRRWILTDIRYKP
jgi:hypothetical protein